MARPILYLHGFASSPGSSKAVFFRTHLEAAGFGVTIPDLAGGDFEHLTLSRQLAVIEREAAGRPVDLMGSSMGGYLAALYAARHPEVGRLVLLAPAFGFAQRWHDRLDPEEMERWRRTNSLSVYHYGDQRDRVLTYDLMRDAAQYEAFPDCRQPTLIFHGKHDDVVPARYSEEFAKNRANVELHVVDSGHDLLNVLEWMRPRVEAFFQKGE